MMAKVISSLGSWLLAFQLSFTKSRSHEVLYFFFWRENNSNMSEIRNLYPNALSINSLFLRCKCERTLDINANFNTTVIYRAGFSPYQVLSESIHSVMLEPNNIEITAVDILSERSFLWFCFVLFFLFFHWVLTLVFLSTL